MGYKTIALVLGVFQSYLQFARSTGCLNTAKVYVGYFFITHHCSPRIIITRFMLVDARKFLLEVESTDFWTLSNVSLALIFLKYIRFIVAEESSVLDV